MTALDIKFQQVKNDNGNISALFTSVNDQHVVLKFTKSELIERINKLDVLGICSDEELNALRYMIDEQNNVDMLMKKAKKDEFYLKKDLKRYFSFRFE